jgi:hypothetical protein
MLGSVEGMNEPSGLGDSTKIPQTKSFFPLFQQLESEPFRGESSRSAPGRIASACPVDDLDDGDPPP